MAGTKLSVVRLIVDTDYRGKQTVINQSTGQKPYPEEDEKWLESGSALDEFKDDIRSNRLRWLIVLAIVIPMLLGLVYWTATSFFMPKTLVVGVEKSVPEAAIMKEVSKRGSGSWSATKLDIKLFESPSAIKQAYDQGKLDLIVLRSDEAFPSTSQSVVIFRDSTIAFIASEKSSTDDVFALEDQVVGVLISDASERALYERLYLSLKLKPPKFRLIDDIPAALKSLRENEIAALAIISESNFGTLKQVVRRIQKLGMKTQILSTGELEELSNANPGFAEFKIPASSLVKKPATPAEETTIVKIETRLLARSTLDRSYVAEITETIFSKRFIIAR